MPIIPVINPIIPPGPQPRDPKDDVTDIPTLRGYRFSGFKFEYDAFGNIIGRFAPIDDNEEWSESDGGGTHENGN